MGKHIFFFVSSAVALTVATFMVTKSFNIISETGRAEYFIAMIISGNYAIACSPTLISSIKGIYDKLKS